MSSLRLKSITSDQISQRGEIPVTLKGTVANPTLPPGSAARLTYERIGRLVYVCFALANTGNPGADPGSGAYYVDLPFPADPNYTLQSGAVVYSDPNSPVTYLGGVVTVLDTTFNLLVWSSATDVITFGSGDALLTGDNIALNATFTYVAKE